MSDASRQTEGQAGRHRHTGRQADRHNRQTVIGAHRHSVDLSMYTCITCLAVQEDGVVARGVGRVFGLAEEAPALFVRLRVTWGEEDRIA